MKESAEGVLSKNEADAWTAHVKYQGLGLITTQIQIHSYMDQNQELQALSLFQVC